MKYDKNKIALIFNYQYNFYYTEAIDWETEKSFGKRGETVKGIRSSWGTGRMYRKDDTAIAWVIFETQEEADSFIDANLSHLRADLDKAIKDVSSIKDKIRSVINKKSSKQITL